LVETCSKRYLKALSNMEELFWKKSSQKNTWGF
jgi:hypothetical protein